MKRKIGILTFHDTTNFGSALQSYALCKAIRDLGGDSEIIDYQCSAIVERENIKTAYKGVKGVIKYVLFGRKNQSKHVALINLLKSESMIGAVEFTKDNIADANQIYDVFVSGSDIIWGVDITDGDFTYFLDFVSPDKKRFAFASSIGDRWSSEYDKEIGELLRKYEKIFVREKNSVKIIEEVANKSSQLVCDPTMLVTPEYWENFAARKKIKEKYVLVYFGNEHLIQKAKVYARDNDCKVLVINYGIPKSGVKNVRPVSAEDFLGLIKNAEYIFTGSYHGMLFSLYFRKQFAVYNRAHASRMNSLLDEFGLNKCILSNADSPICEINYDDVFPMLEKKRVESLQCLNEILR